jgi:hypothetical protein
MTYRKLLAAATAAVVITTVALGLVASVSAADKYKVIYNFGGSDLISDARRKPVRYGIMWQRQQRHCLQVVT